MTTINGWVCSKDAEHASSGLIPGACSVCGYPMMFETEAQRNARIGSAGIKFVGGQFTPHKVCPVSSLHKYTDASLGTLCGECGTALIDARPDAAYHHPSHYGGDTTYEVIKVIEAWELDFCLGNSVKYISRAGKKDRAKELEDLNKAAWYLRRRIEQLTGGKKS